MDKIKQPWWSEVLSIKDTAYAGEYTKALAHVEGLYESCPDACNGYAAVAQVCFEQGNPAKAHDCFMKEIVGGRITPGNRLNAAVCFAAEGDMAKAESQIKTAYEQDTSLLDGYCRTGVAFPNDMMTKKERFLWMKKDVGNGKASSSFLIKFACQAMCMNEQEQALRAVENAYVLDPKIKDARIRAFNAKYSEEENRDLFLRWVAMESEDGRLSAGAMMRAAAALAQDRQTFGLAIEYVQQAYEQRDDLFNGYSRCAWLQYGAERNLPVIHKYMDMDVDKGRLRTLQWTGKYALVLGEIEDDVGVVIQRLSRVYASDEKSNGLFEKAAERMFRRLYLKEAKRLLDAESRRTLEHERMNLALRREEDFCRLQLLKQDAEKRNTLSADFETLENGEKERKSISIGGNVLQIVSLFDARIQFREIFLEEQYAFKAQSDHPVIIDGGGNVGLSVAWFTKNYPTASITVFEPNPVLYDCLKKNIESGGWNGVNAIAAALGPAEGMAVLYVDDDMPMGGHVVLCDKERGNDKREENVEVVCLSNYLQQPVDFLKLDIEGLETAVLQEVGTRLQLVREGIIEYHYNVGSSENCLSDLLQCLENNDFSYWVYPSSVYRNKDARVVVSRWSMMIRFQQKEILRKV